MPRLARGIHLPGIACPPSLPSFSQHYNKGQKRGMDCLVICFHGWEKLPQGESFLSQPERHLFCPK